MSTRTKWSMFALVFLIGLLQVLGASEDFKHIAPVWAVVVCQAALGGFIAVKLWLTNPPTTKDAPPVTVQAPPGEPLAVVETPPAAPTLAVSPPEATP